MTEQHPHHKQEHHEPAEEKPVDTRHSLKIILIVASIVIIIILGLYSMMWYSTNQMKKQYAEENTATFNGFYFEKYDDGLWYMQMLVREKTYVIPFRYNPYQVADVKIDNANQLSRFFYNLSNTNHTIYMTLDPEKPSGYVMAGTEVARILGKAYGIYNLNVQGAFTHTFDGMDEKYPVITCANESEQIIVLTVEEGPKNTVTRQGNCIKIIGTNVSETVRVADALSFRLLRVMG